MIVDKIYIKNYKIFREQVIHFNDTCNIIVGNNDSGKTSLLEILQILLTGKLNGLQLERQLRTNLFNLRTRNEYIKKILGKEKNLILPEIVLEAYFTKDSSNPDFMGTNNHFGENVAGIHLEIGIKQEYTSIYSDLLFKDQITDIPVEFYEVKLRSFKDSPIIYRNFPVKVSIIDTTQKDYSSVLNRFINSSIIDNLDENEVVMLSKAYRKTKTDFNSNSIVNELNSKIKNQIELNSKNIKFEIKEEAIEEWKNQITIDIEDIPFENLGFGTQNLIKMELAYKEKSPKMNILLFEEPENNLSFSNMSRLISKMQIDQKQIFITTHSSFVANKLGLKNIILLKDGLSSQLNKISDETMNYFMKLPGYNTLRFLLSNKAILVEGSTDELILQRAYKDSYKKLPIEEGTDIIAVESLAFKRYCELAISVNCPLVIVTDNDGNIQKNINEKYSEYLNGYEHLIKIYFEEDEKLSTLENSLLAVNVTNESDFLNFKKVISKRNSLMNKNEDEILNYMLDNKAEWGLRVFDAEESVIMPEYIKNAIKK